MYVYLYTAVFVRNMYMYHIHIVVTRDPCMNDDGTEREEARERKRMRGMETKEEKTE